VSLLKAFCRRRRQINASGAAKDARVHDDARGRLAQRPGLRFLAGMPSPQRADPGADLVRYVQKLLIAAAVGALALVIYRWHHVLLLAFGATLMAVLLRSLADPIRRRTPLGASASLGVAVIGLVLILVALGWFAGAQVTRQLVQLQNDLPAAWAAAQRQLAAYEGGPWLLARIHEISGAEMSGNIGPLAGRIGHATGLGVQVAGEFVVVLVAGVYFAAQPKLYRDGLLKLAPPGARERLTEAVEACGVALRKWLLGAGVAMLAMGVLTTIGTALLGLPAPIALGLLSGAAEFVPIVGAAVSAIPGLLLAATLGPQMILWTLAFYVAVHQFEGHVLIPLIQRRVVAVPPALTLFAVVGFGVLFGPSGVVFATPLAVVVLVLVQRLYLREDEPVAEADEATQPVGARGKI
jgi:predicted PurR-regulated permease PerM